MPDFNFSQSNNNFNQSSLENTYIRTMQSDLEKLKEEGGNLPTGEIPSSFSQFPSQSFSQGPSQESSSSFSQSFSQKESETNFEIPPIQPTETASIPEVPSPENLSFSPYQTPPPEGPSPQEFVSSDFTPSSPKKSKLLFPLILAVILVGVGVLGYFVIWPKISKKITPVVSTTTSTILTTVETTIAPTTTTTTTLPPSPFVRISSPYEKAPVSIKIIGSLVVASLKKEVLESPSSLGTFKVLMPLAKDVLTTEEVVLSLIPNIPERLKNIVLDGKYLVYAYYGEVNPSLGLILEVDKENMEEAQNVFLSWEKGKIISDLSNFVLAEMPKKITCKFKESELVGAKVRFCDFGTKEKGIGYAFFDQYLVISSSLESLQSAINHLQGEREAIYPSLK